MTWNIQYKIRNSLPIAESAPTVDSVLGTPTLDSRSSFSEAEDAQIVMAKKLARELVLSGICGTPPLKVELNGHSNLENEPEEGWSYDSVTINVHSMKGSAS